MSGWHHITFQLCLFSFKEPLKDFLSFFCVCAHSGKLQFRNWSSPMTSASRHVFGKKVLVTSAACSPFNYLFVSPPLLFLFVHLNSPLSRHCQRVKKWDLKELVSREEGKRRLNYEVFGIFLSPLTCYIFTETSRLNYTELDAPMHHNTVNYPFSQSSHWITFYCTWHLTFDLTHCFHSWINAGNAACTVNQNPRISSCALLDSFLFRDLW